MVYCPSSSPVLPTYTVLSSSFCFLSSFFSIYLFSALIYHFLCTHSLCFPFLSLYIMFLLFPLLLFTSFLLSVFFPFLSPCFLILSFTPFLFPPPHTYSISSLHLSHFSDFLSISHLSLTPFLFLTYFLATFSLLPHFSSLSVFLTALSFQDFFT